MCAVAPAARGFRAPVEVEVVPGEHQHREEVWRQHASKVSRDNGAEFLAVHAHSAAAKRVGVTEGLTAGGARRPRQVVLAEPRVRGELSREGGLNHGSDD